MLSAAFSARSKRGPLRRLLRWIFLLLLAALALPYALTVAYRTVDPVSTLMLWRWATGQKVERSLVRLDAVSPVLPRSVIVAEDALFCTHQGVDWKSLRTVIEDSDDLSEARGGSTLVQQLAKNLFLWPGRSYVRKALELPLALWIDLVLPKGRIMELYLNVAEWGPEGQFGIEAGARRAFGKSARHLTAREAALLAAVLPNPRKRLAGRPGPGLRRLAGIYDARARQAGGADDCLR